MDKETYSWGGIGFLAFWLCSSSSSSLSGAVVGTALVGVTTVVTGLCRGVVMVSASVLQVTVSKNYRATCDAEKAEIINTAATQYKTIEQAQLTRDTVNATANATQAKIDFYAYQDLRDRLSEEQRKVLTLENQLFVKDQLAPLTASVADIRCNMLTKPVVNGLGTSCNPIITPYMFGLGNGCGCNGLV